MVRLAAQIVHLQGVGGGGTRPSYRVLWGKSQKGGKQASLLSVVVEPQHVLVPSVVFVTLVILLLVTPLALPQLHLLPPLVLQVGVQLVKVVAWLSLCVTKVR